MYRSPVGQPWAELKSDQGLEPLQHLCICLLQPSHVPAHPEQLQRRVSLSYEGIWAGQHWPWQAYISWAARSCFHEGAEYMTECMFKTDAREADARKQLIWTTTYMDQRKLKRTVAHMKGPTMKWLFKRQLVQHVRISSAQPQFAHCNQPGFCAEGVPAK